MPISYNGCMKVVLIHGKDTNPGDKWYPWLAKELQKRGIEYIAPVLPHTHDPYMSEWLYELEKTNPDEETILIGHSRGGVAVLRYLEMSPEDRKVKKVILIATNSGFNIQPITESNHGFYTEKGYDFGKIKKHCDKFVVMHSKDDPWVPYNAGEENAKGLNAKFLSFENYEHFGKRTKEIPELIEEMTS